MQNQCTESQQTFLMPAACPLRYRHAQTRRCDIKDSSSRDRCLEAERSNSRALRVQVAASPTPTSAATQTMPAALRNMHFTGTNCKARCPWEREPRSQTPGKLIVPTHSRAFLLAIFIGLQHLTDSPALLLTVCIGCSTTALAKESGYPVPARVPSPRAHIPAIVYSASQLVLVQNFYAYAPGVRQRTADHMALDRVSTSGAALAALLTSLATSPSDVDGFILGDCHPGYCTAHCSMQHSFSPWCRRTNTV